MTPITPAAYCLCRYAAETNLLFLTRFIAVLKIELLPTWSSTFSMGLYLSQLVTRSSFHDAICHRTEAFLLKFTYELHLGLFHMPLSFYFSPMICVLLSAAVLKSQDPRRSQRSEPEGHLHLTTSVNGDTPGTMKLLMLNKPICCEYCSTLRAKLLRIISLTDHLYNLMMSPHPISGARGLC